jgi:hypothetical protein
MKLTDLTAHLRTALGFNTAAQSAGNDPFQQAQRDFIHEVLGAMDEKQSRIDNSSRKAMLVAGLAI